MTRAAELSAASPSLFSAIRTANNVLLGVYALHPTAFPKFAEDAALIAAEAARRDELNRTHTDRLDACVREIIAGRSGWGDLARINAGMAAQEEREERRAAA